MHRGVRSDFVMALRPRSSNPRLIEAPRRVDPSPDERAWFGVPALSPAALSAAYEREAHASAIPSHLREAEIARKIREAVVQDVWCEIDVSDGWRAALRLMPYAGQAVIGELRLFPRDDWPGRPPGQWRAEMLGVHAPTLVGERAGRTTDSSGRPWKHALDDRASRTASFSPVRHGITAQLLRQVPLGQHTRVTREFIQAVRKEWGHTKSYQNPDGSLEPAPEPFPQFVRPTIASPQRRAATAWPDVRYAKLAADYVARLEVGSRRAVADVAAASRGSLSAAQVRDAIHTARRRGLLSPTTKQGRPGGQLTARAKALLQTSHAQKRRSERRATKARRR